MTKKEQAMATGLGHAARYAALLSGLIAGLASPSRASAEPAANVVGKVEARGEGERTVVIVHGSTTPSFTAYRLEQPARLVVDVANARLLASSGDGPMDVDTWAVGQIATAQYATERVKTARVMIGLKRACTYDVRPRGNDLYVMITASEPAPASATGPSSAAVEAAAHKAREAEHAAVEAQKRRQESEAAAELALKKKAQHESDAVAAETRARELGERAAVAERRAQELAERAAAAEARGRDLAREAAAAETRRREVLARLSDEEQRLAALREARAEEERRSKKASDAQKAETEASRRAEAARLEADTAKARAIATRAEVERLQAARVAEEQKIAELQRRAEAGGAAERRELERLREEAKAEHARLAALKQEAERQAAQRVEELKKIDEAQAETRRAAEKRAKALDEARAIADRRAHEAAAARLADERRAQTQADEAARGKAAAEAAAKLATTEAQRRAAEEAAQKAQARAHADESRAQQLRADAERIADEAQKARAQVEAARAEMGKLAEAQTRERARLESSRLEAQRLADQRQLEIERQSHMSAIISGERAKVEAAEREAKRLAELRQKESLRLEAVRKAAEEAQTQRAAELQKIEDARATQRATVAAHERELRGLAERRDRELRALAEARAGEEAKIVAARLEVARARTELNALQAQRSGSKDEIARAREEIARGKEEAARSRAEAARTKEEVERSRQEAARTKEEVARTREEAARSKEEIARTREEAARSKDAMDRSRAEIDQRRSEREAIERKITEARAELERAEGRVREATQRANAAQERAPVAAAPVPAISPRTKELARSGVSPVVQVRDVRFADDAEAHRVVIEVAGEPLWRTTPSQKGELTLSLKGAALPQRLERTLDTAAYRGPVRAVSTFADPADPGAVKVVVALDQSRKGGEPKVVKEGDRIVWEFPREAHATSITPTRVSGYGASIPLQVAAAQPTNLSAPAPQMRRRPTYSGRRIDLDFKDFDIHNILRLLSDVGQVNIITSDDVKGTVTIRMRDVPWDQALDVILKSKGLGMQREGNLIRVAPMAQLEKEMEAEVARARAAVELKPLDTRLIPISYADGEKMLPRVQELLSSRGKVSVDPRTNMLIVSDVAANIALAEDLVRNLDTQTPQVMIEARVVEASQSFVREVGIQWGGNTINSAGTGNPTGLVFPSTVGVAGVAADGTGVTGLQGAAAANPNYVVNLPAPTGSGSGGGLGFVFGSLNGNYNINLRLSALESTGQVRIVSSPKITTLDNIEASIEQGTSLPISVVSAAGTNTVYIDAKLNLTVKPHVTNEGSVVMHVQVTRNEPDFSHTSQFGNPAILKRQAKTEMLVRDGDTAVIGGIYTRNSGVSFKKLPWIADVPILGWLFKNRHENDDRSELLIFITPRIVNRQLVAR
jgi:type IV pilus assembly protein PilQ